MTMTLFAFKLDSSLKARLEKFALARGKTQGEVLRGALTSYLANWSENELERKHGELGMSKRVREMLEAMPKDTHDGVMLVSRIDDIIQKQIEELRKKGWLEVDDYDHFIRLVKENKKVVETYAEAEWLSRKLDMLVNKLEKEKRSFGEKTWQTTMEKHR